MTHKGKSLTLVLLFGALAALILLVTSLTNLQFQPGVSLPASTHADGGIIPTTPLVKSYSFPMLQGILALVFILFLIYLTARIFSSVGIKTILQLSLIVLLLLVIVTLFPRITLDGSPAASGGSAEIGSPPAFTYPIVPLGEPPQILIWLVILGIGFGVGSAAIKVIKERLRPPTTRDKLLAEAEHAVSALQAGGNLSNVIMRCYVQMTHALKEERGVERNYSMTVREFEDWLMAMNFPSVPIHQLTSLFEKVRYGEVQSAEKDELVALESLYAIIEFCQNGRAPANGKD